MAVVLMTLCWRWWCLTKATPTDAAAHASSSRQPPAQTTRVTCVAQKKIKKTEKNLKKKQKKNIKQMHRETLDETIINGA